MHRTWWLAIVVVGLVGCGDKQHRVATVPEAANIPAEGDPWGAGASDPEPQIAAATLPTDPDAPLPLDRAVRTGTLPNGLTYFVRANKEPANRAVLRLVVNAGSLNEDEDQRGLAHFVEHMAFNGTKSFPKNELISKLQQLGIQFGPHLNAETIFDETVYKLAVPSDKPDTVELSLQILREWAGDITFLPADVEAERGVVLAEQRDKLGAQMRMLETAIEKLFGGTRYASRIPIGLTAVLKQAKPETFIRFYRDWYRPDNMAVVAVGDFDPIAMEKAIVARFGDLSNPTTKRAPPSRELPKRSETMFFDMTDKELPMSAVALARLVPARRHASTNDYRRDLIEGVVGIMLSKRLEEAKQKGGARYLTAGGAPVPLVRGADAMVWFAAVQPQQMREGLEDLLAELERARRHGFTPGELKRAFDQMIAIQRNHAKEAAAGKGDSTALAEELRRHFLSNESVPGRHVELALTEQLAKTVTPDDAKRVIAELLDARDLVIAGVGPAGAKLISRADALAELAKLPKKQLIAYSDTKSDRPLIATPPAPGTIVAERNHPEVGVVEWTLSNGAHVFLKPTKFKADEIRFRAMSAGGNSLSSPAAFKRTFAAADIVRRGGIGDHDAIELEKLLAGRRVELTPYIGNRTEGMQGSSSADDFETLLQLAHLSFVAPRLDRKAFALWRESTLSEVKLAGNRPETRFSRKLTPLQQNHNPRVLVANEQTYKQIDLNASFALYRERFKDAGDFQFMIIGSFDPEAIKPLVLRYLGSLPDAPRTETFRVHPWPVHTRRKRLELRDGSDPRAALNVYYQRQLADEAVTPADRLAWLLFGDAMELELLELFREKMGDSYSISAWTWIDRKDRYPQLGLELTCAPERVAEVEKVALAEIERVVTNGVGQAWFEKAKQAALKRHETQLETNAYWIDELSDRLLYGAPLAEIPGYKQLIEATTLADVQKAAQRFVDLKAPVIGVLLPKK
ncbi:MAG: M16 family metallopeptidase [Kofleriaceae bacterium]